MNHTRYEELHHQLKRQHIESYMAEFMNEVMDESVLLGYNSVEEIKVSQCKYYKRNFLS